jgi:hypothetical protein
MPHFPRLRRRIRATLARFIPRCEQLEDRAAPTGLPMRELVLPPQAYGNPLADESFMGKPSAPSDSWENLALLTAAKPWTTEPDAAFQAWVTAHQAGPQSEQAQESPTTRAAPVAARPSEPLPNHFGFRPFRR